MANELSNRRRIGVLVAMLAALVAVIVAVTGLNVALVDLMVELNATSHQVLWIVNAYTLTLAALLLGIGDLGDRYGRKRILMAGLILFAAANGATAFAPNAITVIALRSVAGLAAAMIMPATLSVITSVFRSGERGRAVGLWAGFAGAGGVIGLYASAAIIDFSSWPWLFTLPVSLAVISLILTGLLVPGGRPSHRPGYDVIGTLLSILAVGGLVLGMQDGPEYGWGSALTVTAFVVGGVAIAAFIGWELRRAYVFDRGGQVPPILDVRIFGHRTLSSGALNLAFVFLLIFGSFLVVIQYFQSILDYSALQATAGLLPMAIAMMVISPVAPRMSYRIGLRWVLVIGNAMVALGFVWMSQLDGQPGYFQLVRPMMLIGIGVGFSMSPSTTAITESLPAAKQGVASALNDTVREVGAAMGIAIMGSLITSGYRDGIGPALKFLPDEVADIVDDGIGQALGVAAQAGPEFAQQAEQLVAVAKAAFTNGWHASMLAAGIIASVSAVVIAVFAPGRGVDTPRALDATLDGGAGDRGVDPDEVADASTEITEQAEATMSSR